MKKSVIIKMINKFYLNLADSFEAAMAISLLKKPGRDRLLTKIMKRHWDSIKNGNMPAKGSDGKK